MLRVADQSLKRPFWRAESTFLFRKLVNHTSEVVMLEIVADFAKLCSAPGEVFGDLTCLPQVAILTVSVGMSDGDRGNAFGGDSV